VHHPGTVRIDLHPIHHHTGQPQQQRRIVHSRPWLFMIDCLQRFPRFTGKRHGMSCRFTTGVLGLVDRDRLHVERGTARIRSATVPHRAGRWQVSSSVEINRNDPGPARPGSVVGIDLGINSNWVAFWYPRSGGAGGLDLERLAMALASIALQGIFEERAPQGRDGVSHVIGLLRRTSAGWSEWSKGD
jgi:hypothetical protein